MCIYAVILIRRIKRAEHQSGSMQKKKVAQWMQDFTTSALGSIVCLQVPLLQQNVSTNETQRHSWPKISLNLAELCQSYHFSGNLIQFYEFFSTAYHLLKTDSKKSLKVDEGQIK